MKAQQKKRRISPRGMINLPFDARLALGFVKGKGAYLSFKVENDTVVVEMAKYKSAGAVKASPKGLLQLPAAAFKVLTDKAHRYCYVIKDNVLVLKAS